MAISESEQDEIEEIILLMDSPKRGTPLDSQIIEEIATRIERLVRGNAELRGFLESAKTTASARAIKDWSSRTTDNSYLLKDSPWNTLADRLNQVG
jgi:hypothetical protein